MEDAQEDIRQVAIPPDTLHGEGEGEFCGVLRYDLVYRSFWCLAL